MTDTPFMPKATAVWLVENTTLTFKQIAEFCNLHELEIKGIADGDVAKGIKAYNPILAGQLSREEIETCSKNPEKELRLLKKIEEVEIKETVPLVLPTSFEICPSVNSDAFLHNHKIASGLSCLFDKGVYFGLFLSLTSISSIFFNNSNFFSGLFEHFSISSLDNCPAKMGL